MRGTAQERFESKYWKGESSECWNWMTGKDDDGYGQFYLDRRTLKAHRFSYKLYVGEIPDGLCVCHHCDNPSCVNPSHLFLGTNIDNVHDRDNKHRCKSKLPDTSGEKNSHAKLIEEDIRTIRMMWADGSRQVDLARRFGVSRQNIFCIVHHLNWTKI